MQNCYTVQDQTDYPFGNSFSLSKVNLILKILILTLKKKKK